MSSRFEIKGQFTIDNTFSSWRNRDEVVIDRNASLAFVPPRNWTTFCTDVDTALQAVTKAKQFHKIFGTFSWIILATYVVLMVVRLVFLSDIGSYANSVIPYLFILAFIPFVVTYYVTRFKVESGMQKIERVCQNHSSDGVEYRLRDESWGGCNERHTKRYYVTIKCTSVEQQQVATVFINVTSTQPESWNDEACSTSTSVRLKVTASSANTTTTVCDPESSAPYLQDISAPPPSGTSIFDQLSKK